MIGEVTADGNFSYGNTVITVDEAENAWKGTLEKVFKTVSSENDKEAADRDEKLYRADSIYVCKNKVAKPRVFIPVFPGTNCEYDSTRAFERAGAEVDVKVFKNLTAEDIHDSVELFEKAIDQAQIIMFPGGFSAGDEPDGSAKFFATAFQNAKIKEAVMKLINERDGLALGICNGFQALIKLGLVPYGEICGQKADSPTLTFNTIGRHISKNDVFTCDKFKVSTLSFKLVCHCVTDCGIVLVEVIKSSDICFFTHCYIPLIFLF